MSDFERDNLGYNTVKVPWCHETHAWAVTNAFYAVFVAWIGSAWPTQLRTGVILDAF
ncbi:MAG: hypothetical protein WBO17_04455 [Sphingorhabdus sp.]